MFGVFIFIG